jgi:hypothetical protein
MALLASDPMTPNLRLAQVLESLRITEPMIIERRRQFTRGLRAPEAIFGAFSYGPPTVMAIVELVMEATAKETSCAA